MFLFVTHLFNAKYLFKCIKVEWKNENVFFSKQRMCRPFMAFRLITHTKNGDVSPRQLSFRPAAFCGRGTPRPYYFRLR